MKAYAKCVKCERTTEVEKIYPFVIVPHGWAEVIIQVTGHGEMGRNFVLCDACRPDACAQIERATQG